MATVHWSGIRARVFAALLLLLLLRLLLRLRLRLRLQLLRAVVRGFPKADEEEALGADHESISVMKCERAACMQQVTIEHAERPFM